MNNYGWDARILNTAPKNETVADVLIEMRNNPFLNRGRWAALVVRLGAATKRAHNERLEKSDTKTKM